jgi:hypothetical protein
MRLHRTPARLAARSGWSGCGQVRFPELHSRCVSRFPNRRENSKRGYCNLYAVTMYHLIE